MIRVTHDPIYGRKVKGQGHQSTLRHDRKSDMSLEQEGAS